MRALPGVTLLLLIAFSPQSRADALNPSCKAGDPFSCLDGAPSMAGATRACTLGQPKGCMVAAGLLMSSKTPKPGEAITWFDKACTLGEPLGCYELGLLLTDVKGKRLDYPRAFVVLYRSCRQGYGPACTMVGALHADGLGTAKDATRAAMAFRNGCERKDPKACVLLGQLLVKPIDAASAFQQACQLKDADGCARLEALAKTGVKPTPKLAPLKDPMIEKEKTARSLPGGRNPVAFVEVKACKAVEPACVSGDLAVCQVSADLQENGGDGAAAFCMKRQACDRGDGFACDQLGFAFEGGGLPTSPKTALAWYEKGCSRGSASSCASAVRLIDFVEATSTPNERATRKLDLWVKGCGLDDAGDCALVYTALLTRIPEADLVHRAWVTLGRWCEKDTRQGPACAAVDDRRKAIVLERECQAGKALSCSAAAALFSDLPRQLSLLGKACTLGDCDSCVARHGLDSSKANLLAAAQVCPAQCKTAAVDQPEPKACAAGLKALTDLGGVANERKALGFAEAHCKRGLSCAPLAEVWVMSEGLPAADDARIAALLERACADKKPGTCQAPTELAQIKPARALCKQGKVEGCLRLGEQLKASSVAQSQTTEAWTRACSLGSNLGCVRQWAATRADVPHQKASRACEAGEIDICIELANHLKFRPDDAVAIEELKAVGEKVTTTLGGQCDSGSAEACEAAANFLQFKKELNGEARAKEFIQKACDHGSAARCLELAEQDVKVKDFAGAAELGARACAAGSTAGCRLMSKHRSELSATVRVEADRALGVACGKKVAEACALATDAGVPMVIEASRN